MSEMTHLLLGVGGSRGATRNGRGNTWVSEERRTGYKSCEDIFVLLHTVGA